MKRFACTSKVLFSSQRITKTQLVENRGGYRAQDQPTAMPQTLSHIQVTAHTTQYTSKHIRTHKWYKEGSQSPLVTTRSF
eukprot:1287912-Amphidinium_carterae.1